MHPLILVAGLLSASILGLIVLGGIVHSTGSSLACPDWPTCHGTLFPELTGGVLFEHAHRLLAFWVAIIVVGLAIWVRISSLGTPALLRWTRLLVALLALQVLLGASTVRFRLPPAVSAAHLATALLLFATNLTILHTLLQGSSTSPYRRSTKRWASWAVLAAFVQIVAGGVVRHTGASLSCLDFPFCAGLRWDGLQQLPLIHMLHRALAIPVLVTVIGLCRSAFVEHAAGRKRLLPLAIAAAVFAGLQPLLGIWSIVSRLDPGAATLHLAVGALLFGALILMRRELVGAHG